MTCHITGNIKPAKISWFKAIFACVESAFCFRIAEKTFNCPQPLI